ncbi:hypothetical protein GF412_02110 [Candidatus Micrarchaeota archaeon]|nr:hypothetical protein [Candidatus Micrarchaeota archaeon]MBD3417756.1 hypothetical protein [Candidatus Micrarchaeota archaeon]
MDKSLIVKVAVVILALLFLMQPFAMSIQNWASSGGGEGGTIYTGTANVNVTIYSYGAFLYMQAPTELQKTQISSNPEVLSLEETEEGSGFYRATLRDSAKTMQVHNEFSGMGVQSFASAQIGLPEKYTVELENGTEMEIFGGYQQMLMEPVLDTGRKVSYMLAVETDGTNTYRILDAKSYYTNVELSGEATVVGANTSAYSFAVPWEERELALEEIIGEYGEGNVTYERKDYIIFDPPLSSSETMFMKKDYVTYISEGSASVASNFTNRSLAEQDLGERAVFPDSRLMVVAGTPPNITFEYENVKTYTIEFPGEFDGYVLEAGEIQVASEEDFETGETVEARFNATVTGDLVLGVMEIYINKVD